MLLPTGPYRAGVWGLPVPHHVPLMMCIGKPIEVQRTHTAASAAGAGANMGAGGAAAEGGSGGDGPQKTVVGGAEEEDVEARAQRLLEEVEGAVRGLYERYAPMYGWQDRPLEVL